jgi:outer membrane protein TolC
MLVSVHKHISFLSFVLLVIPNAHAQLWSLQKCVDTAQVHNRSLQMASNSILIGAEKQKEATANLIPKLSVNADYKYFTDLPTQLMPLSTFNASAPVGKFKEAQFGVPHNLNANVQLSMPLYNPQIFGTIKTTNEALVLSNLQYKKSEDQVLVDVYNQYYSAQILTHQLRFVDSNMVNSDRLLKNMQLLKTQMLVKGTDVSKIELQLSQLSAQKATINSKLQQVLNALKFSMGVSLDQGITIDDNIKYEPGQEESLNNSIDIELAKAQHKLTKVELNNLKYSRLPTLSLMAYYGTTGFGYDKKPSDFLKFFPMSFVGVQFNYPLFNGTVTLRKINQKKLELKNTELQEANAIALNTMQVQNATLQRDVATQTLNVSEKQILLAQNIYTQALLQQQQGVATLTDVLLADTALREAQQNYLSAIIDYAKADVELKKVTGNISIHK